MSKWKSVPGLPGYEASTSGEIKCLATDHVTLGGDAGRYLKVEVARDGKRPLEYVHILVCTTYHGKPKEGDVVLHKDDDTKNNRPSNLKWGTQSENIQQAYDRGRVPGKKSSNEAYMDFRDSLDQYEGAVNKLIALEASIEELDQVATMLRKVPNDPVVTHMAFISLESAYVHLPDLRSSGASLETFNMRTGLEDMEKFKESAIKVAKQVAKTMREAWDKLVAWFKEYVKKVGERCKQLRLSLREKKVTGMTKVAANNMYEAARTAKTRANDAYTALRASGGKSTPEAAAVLGEVSKAVTELPKAVVTDASAFVADSGDSSAASPQDLDKVAKEISDLNDTVGKLNHEADKVMKSVEKQMTETKDAPPGKIGSDGKATGGGINTAKKGELTKLSSAIQAINRSGSSLTQKVLGGITKAITMTIPAPGDDKKE